MPRLKNLLIIGENGNDILSTKSTMAKEESVTPEGADNKSVTQTYRNADNPI